MNKYGLHGKFKATEGNADQLAKILIMASELVSTAKGCRLYVVSKDNINENFVWVTEIWDSREDHDNSLNVKGVRELIAEAMPLLDDQPEMGQVLNILGGTGIS